MVPDTPGHSRKVGEAPGQKLKKVEKKSKNDKMMVSDESRGGFGAARMVPDTPGRSGKVQDKS